MCRQIIIYDKAGYQKLFFASFFDFEIYTNSRLIGKHARILKGHLANEYLPLPRLMQDFCKFFIHLQDSCKIFYSLARGFASFSIPHFFYSVVR